MSRSRDSESTGCVKIVRMGCLALAILLVAGLALVAVNFDRIRSSDLVDKVVQGAETVRESLGPMAALRADLQDRYSTEDIELTLMLSDSAGIMTLQVRLEEAVFGRDAPERERDRALEVALLALDHYEEVPQVARISVDFSGKRSWGLQITTRGPNVFEREELEALRAGSTPPPPEQEQGEPSE